MNLEVRIVNELCAHFAEVRILNGLGDGVAHGRGKTERARRTERRVSRLMIPASLITVKRIFTGQLFERAQATRGRRSNVVSLGRQP
jgi:hypothetical protein